MFTYKCDLCMFKTNIKTHYTKHLASLKHTKRENIQKNDPENSLDFINLQCQYCFKTFKSRHSRSRHEKNNCKLNEKLSYEKLASLLNEKDSQVQKYKGDLVNYESRIEKLECKIEKLMSQLKIQNIGLANQVNGNNNNLNSTNIQLLNYNQTDYDFLTPKDFIKCFQENNHCVKALIEKVHFNKNKPENMNIYISCINGKYVMVYRDSKWQIRDRQTQIDDLYDTNELVLDNWFEEYSDKYPHIIASFKRYLKNKDEDDTIIKKVKYEILMMLYNQRDIIEERRIQMASNDDSDSSISSNE